MIKDSCRNMKLLALSVLLLAARSGASQCGWREQRLELHKGESIELTTPESDAFCKANWHVDLIRGRNDISQWKIKVEIIDIDLACSDGTLNLEEDTDPKITEKYCGDKKKTFHSHEHDLYISYINKVGKGGVKLRISSEYVCGGRFTKKNGYITSPFYPNNYSDDITCIYQISAPEGSRKRPTINCHDFNLSTKCKGACKPDEGDRDYLLDLMTFESYEGKSLQGKTIKSNRFHQSLYFVSNDYHLWDGEGPYGFNCTYSF